MSDPLVSVMVPTYNQAEWVIRAVESVRAQSYKNLEIVVSDDFSTDDTENVFHRYLEEVHDPRIRYQRGAFNVGILRNYHDTLLTLKGEYVVNLDGDDFFIDENFLREAVEITQNNRAVVMVFANYCEIRRAGGSRVDVVNGKLPQVMSSENFLRIFAAGGITWNHNVIFYKREPAIRIGFYWDAVVPRNDWESFLRLAIGNSVAYLPIVAAAWVQHEASETRRIDIEKYLNNFALVKGVATAMQGAFGEAFIASWISDMLWLKMRSSSIAFIRKRDFFGLYKFCRSAYKVSPILILRAFASPGLIARCFLSISPKLYDSVKKLVRSGLVRRVNG